MSNACSTARSCHAISSIVLNVATALLREHAVDGLLRLADAERILDLIGRGSLSLDDAYRLQEERCRKQRQAKGNVGTRSNPFQRLMVRPFEELLAGAEPAFPRPYLANYFAFVEYALGPERDEVERDCRAIIQALLVVYGNGLNWEHFYSDPRTLRLLRRALQLVVHTLSADKGALAWHKLMARPPADLPPLEAARSDQVRDILLETYRGLAA